MGLFFMHNFILELIAYKYKKDYVTGIYYSDNGYKAAAAAEWRK